MYGIIDKLSIELFFDADESHLNEMEFDHYSNSCDVRYLNQYINKFETQYLNIQRKLTKQGKQMEKLNVAKHDNLNAGFGGQLYVLVEHLHKDLSTIDLSKHWLSPHYKPCYAN